MATRNVFGDICLDSEETKNFMDKMIHPDEEALRQLDEFLAECPEFEYDENGCMVFGIDHAKHKDYYCITDSKNFYDKDGKVICDKEYITERSKFDLLDDFTDPDHPVLYKGCTIENVPIEDVLDGNERHITCKIDKKEN